MSFAVTKNAAELVRPSEPTLAVSPLPLSAIDNRPFLGFFQQVVHVYRHGQDPASVIKKAVSTALIAYYPVAGRLRRSECQELEVDCTGDGIYFVEATADCGLEDVDYMDQPPFKIPIDQLLPSPPSDVELQELVILIQVTQFKCGGFTVGTKFNHAFFDAAGIVQFLNAVAEIARGIPDPTTKPVWFRESIVDPQQFDFTFSNAYAGIASSSSEFKEYTMDVSPDQIAQLKNYFTQKTGETCSSFDILTAIVWRCRTKAITVDPNTKVTLVFPINMRRTLSALLPSEGGYYGNYLYISVATATSGEVCNVSLAENIRMVRNAKENFFKKFSTWKSDDPKDDLVEFEISYLSLCVTDWKHTGICEIDYGWGAPNNLSLDLNDIDMPIGGCEMMDSTIHKGGVRLWLQCVLKEHFSTFLDQMKTTLHCSANSAN